MSTPTGPNGERPRPAPAAQPELAAQARLAAKAEGAAPGGPGGAEADPAGRTDRPGAEADPAGAADGPGGPGPLPEVPEALLSGYLDAALATLRAADQGELPGPLRQYQTWTPKRLRHQRVLSLVRRTLDLDQSFRKAVDERVLQEEEALARLVRAGRHAEALASGETPEAVARVGIGRASCRERV